MWKWVGGTLLVLVLLVGTCTWVGYNRLQSMAGDDGPATLMVDAAPARVFATLATGDSVAGWMSVSGSVRASRRGALRVGDTITVVQRGGTESLQRAAWIVTELTPGKLLVLAMTGDGPVTVLAQRRFALEAIGDSTAIISTVASPMVDSVRTQRDSSAMMNFASRMMLTAMRMQSKVELAQLKLHIEGAPAGDSARP